jgi:hypothetical protein
MAGALGRLLSPGGFGLFPAALILFYRTTNTVPERTAPSEFIL